MVRCNQCVFWGKVGGYLADGNLRDCFCPKFVYQQRNEEVDEDGAAYWDSEGCSAGFNTGPMFGCVHGKTQESRDGS